MALDQLLADEDALGNVRWTLADNQGTIRDIVDSDGDVLGHRQYNAFGKITDDWSGSIDNYFAYTGREIDPDTGLQNNRARWYDPATGTWLSPDPIGFAAGDPNLYGYVEDNPTNWTDPTGLDPMAPAKTPAKSRSQGALRTAPASSAAARATAAAEQALGTFARVFTMAELQSGMPMQQGVLEMMAWQIAQRVKTGELTYDEGLRRFQIAAGIMQSGNYRAPTEQRGAPAEAERIVKLAEAEEKKAEAERPAAGAIARPIEETEAVPAKRARRQGRKGATKTVTAEEEQKKCKCDDGVIGPYANLEGTDDIPVAPGRAFHRTQRDKVLAENRRRHGGKLVPDRPDDPVQDLEEPPSVSPQTFPKPPKSRDKNGLLNEAQVDHIKSPGKNGSNSYCNAQVVSQEYNLRKQKEELANDRKAARPKPED